jgi:sulfur relay (sulfurtransferase) complex TusBCD TusD component (DsrE family)
MAEYLLIESRDAFDSNDVSQNLELAKGLAANGNQVTVFLVQNGVLTARLSAKSALLTELSRSGVHVLADEFSLRERGIPATRLTEGVTPAPLDVVIDHMAEGAKTLWH